MITKKNKNLGFTLVEVLVVLFLVGVVSTILMGTVSKVVPDRNVVLLKKTYSNFEQILEALINNDDIYGGTSDGSIAPGNLSYYTGYTDAGKKLCYYTADMLDTTSEACVASSTFTTNDGVIWKFSVSGSNIIVNVDTNGASKTGAEYKFTVSNLGRISVDENTKTVLRKFSSNQ